MGESDKRSAASRSVKALGLGLATTLWCLWLAVSAWAGPPNHPRAAALDISGFNHACGTAVDSQGDVYVASAGESKIRIFDSEHHELNPAISNSEEPCGLAVDSKGNLYVSERAKGEVVRYHPTAYPFAGAPGYEAPVTVDSSGEAEGLSVDPTDDRLYVAEGNRIDSYNPDGSLGINEVQRVFPYGATGGTYKLSFGGEETGPIPYEATHAEVLAALEGLTTIGAGNISVAQGPEPSGRDHLIIFTGALANTDVEQIGCDGSGLEEATEGEAACFAATQIEGFNGHIGQAELTNATGVATYTSPSGDRYLFAADAATDQVKVFSGPNFRSFELRRTIKGPGAGEDFGFGSAGVYLAADPGNRDPVTGKCVSVAEQACTAGHFLVYDDAHEAIDEFEPNGEFLDRIASEEFSDAIPSALAVDRSGGADDGTIYLTTGSGAGAKLLAFEPLAAPSRPPLPELSKALEGASAVAVDSKGNVYVAAGRTLHVYDPEGKEVKVGPGGGGIETEKAAVDMVVDSTGRIYALENKNSGNRATEKVQYYKPDSYPPHDGTKYSSPVKVADGNSFENSGSLLFAIGLNSKSDHVFVANQSQTIELSSAAEGSTVLNHCFACDLGSSGITDVTAYGATGNVYISKSLGTVEVINPSGSKVLARFNGAGGPQGPFSFPPGPIAVDQSNGHVLLFNDNREAGEEYEGGGAFVAEFGKFTDLARPGGIAIDNSGGPSNGNVYFAFDDIAPETFDLTAFGPLTYGETPATLTGLASGLGGGKATLNGTVDPRGFPLEDCHFEYLTDAEYLSNGRTFAGAEVKACAESLAEIGHGSGPVAVHADIAGLLEEERYRFRLVAKNKYGEGGGKAGLFGPPLLTTKAPSPILYSEATLRAQVDPSGLPTEYHFDYGTDGSYGQSTPTVELPPGDGPVAVEAPLVDLSEGSEYHFRIVVGNAAKPLVEGPDQTFKTLQRGKEPEPPCSNTEYRTGLSAKLPDCRAYELTTPAETRGAVPGATTAGSAGLEFNNWLITPRGVGAGESLTFFSGTLPGFEGSGYTDGYHAQRGEGPHPAAGWTTALISPTFAQVGVDGHNQQHGVASDQRYLIFTIAGASESSEETLDPGSYLRTPAGFEAIGRGDLGVDMGAEGRFLSAGGAHVVFSSKDQLEDEAGNEAAPKGTESIYDRAAGSASSEVVSVKPDGTPFDTGEGAAYLGTTEDGSAVAFEVGGTLYLHRAGKTTEVAAAPNTFAGISADGKRVFYAAGASGEAPAALFACDLEAGPCVGGGEAPGLSEIAPASIFVNVSADGSHVFFTSKEVLDDGEEGVGGQPNLYAWDGEGIRFISVLDPEDLESFSANTPVNLRRWTTSITAGPEIGRNQSPTRSTPSGEVLVFQSHAKLTAYDNEGFSEIYRYDSSATPADQINCLSCDPANAPASAEANLLFIFGAAEVAHYSTLVPNVTDDGETVFFESSDRLLPEDANGVQDVYEWEAEGKGTCEFSGGCLSLISSGQGETASYLYGMSADGDDVFFETPEKLVGQDIPLSPSIYDARVEGGIPDPPSKELCHGDACQGQGEAPPVLPTPASSAAGGNGNLPHGGKGCPKAKRKAGARKGHKACAKKPHKPRHRSHRRGAHGRGAGR